MHKTLTMPSRVRSTIISFSNPRQEEVLTSSKKTLRHAHTHTHTHTPHTHTHTHTHTHKMCIHHSLSKSPTVTNGVLYSAVSEVWIDCMSLACWKTFSKNSLISAGLRPDQKQDWNRMWTGWEQNEGRWDVPVHTITTYQSEHLACGRFSLYQH